MCVTFIFQSVEKMISGRNLRSYLKSLKIPVFHNDCQKTIFAITQSNGQIKVKYKNNYRQIKISNNNSNNNSEILAFIQYSCYYSLKYICKYLDN